MEHTKIQPTDILNANNAEFIDEVCKCWNAHDALLAAGKEICKHLIISMMINLCIRCEHNSDDTDPDTCGKCKVSQELQAAIAQAKPEAEE